MKQKAIILALLCITGTLIFSSCEKKKSRSYDDYASYVNSRIDSADRYYDREWNELESEYDMKKSAVERDMKDMDEKSKAEYNRLEERWNNFKTSYSERRGKLSTLRTAIVPAGVQADFSNVSGSQLYGVYKHFVDYVDAHKESFDREQWDEVKLIWERLDAHKNTVEKDLPKGDNGKIAKEKLRYNGIRLFERGSAKAKENEEAKPKE